jgi:hypothetical protein
MSFKPLKLSRQSRLRFSGSQEDAFEGYRHDGSTCLSDMNGRKKNPETGPPETCIGFNGERSICPGSADTDPLPFFYNRFYAAFGGQDKFCYQISVAWVNR